MKATVLILLVAVLLLAGCKGSIRNPVIIPIPPECQPLGIANMVCPVQVNGTQCVVVYYGAQATSIDCDWPK